MAASRQQPLNFYRKPKRKVYYKKFAEKKEPKGPFDPSGAQGTFDKDVGCEVLTYSEKAIGTRWYDYSSGRVRPAYFENGQLLPLLPDLKEFQGKMNSLSDIARFSIVKSIDRYDVDTFRGCSERIGMTIWRDACQFGLDSFRLFRAFAKAFPTAEVFSPSYDGKKGKGRISHLRIRNQAILMERDKLLHSETIDMLSSPSWLVFLSMDASNVNYGYSDLIALAEIPTLASLELSRDDFFQSSQKREAAAVNYHVVRIWARKATEDGKFSNLKFLALRGQREIMKEAIPVFQELRKLPVLTYVDITAVSASATGVPVEPSRLEKLGWSYISKEQLAHKDGFHLNTIKEWPMDLETIYSGLFGDQDRAVCVYGKLCDRSAYDAAGGLYDRIEHRTVQKKSRPVWLRMLKLGNPAVSAKHKREVSETAESKPAKAMRTIKDKKAKELQASFDSFFR